MISELELEDIHETEIPYQWLLKDHITRGVNGSTTFTKVDLLRRRQRVLRTSHLKDELECNETLNTDRDITRYA
jgi:hypothetical protein